MKFSINHTNINVSNLETAVEFYQTALGLHETGRKSAADGSFTLVYMGDDSTEHRIELTWLRDHLQKYDLGENENHIAFVVDDFDAAHKLHSEMGCICFENAGMGIYFVEDPDGYWLEIVPQR